MARNLLSRIAALCLACCALLTPVAGRAAEGPLTTDDVTLLLIGGASTQRMIALIEKRGVNFRMNPDLAKKFHDRGAEDRVIEALQRAGQKLGTDTAVSASSGDVARSVPQPSPPAQASSTAPPTAPTGAASTPPDERTSSSVQRKIAEIMAPDLSANPLAPSFSLIDLSGQRLDLADYRGKVVLLDFWATWCGPCRTEIPEFVQLQKRYGDQGFQVVGISLDERPGPVREFYQRYGMNYPVAMCDANTRSLYGGISAVPTTLLIGRDGRIYIRVEGAPADISSFEGEIKRLLAATAGEGKRGVEQVAVRSPAAHSAPATPAVRPGDSSPAPKSVADNALAPAPAKGPDLSDPGPEQIQRIVQEFAAKEKMFREARNNYTYHQINKVQELDSDGNVTGMFQQDWDIVFDDSGKRIEQVTYAPIDSLKGLIVTQEDLNSMRSIQPFVLTTDELPEYDVKYLGHVKVDEITAYVFSIRPKEIVKGHQYFQGVVWVDDRDLQIVKSEGKTVPETRPRKGQFNLFPRFVTYREQIDGKFWFPTFTIADDTLYFPGQPVRMKQIIKYSDYKQFKSTSTIRIVNLGTAQPGAPPKIEPAKNAPKR